MNTNLIEELQGVSLETQAQRKKVIAKSDKEYFAKQESDRKKKKKLKD